MQIYNSHIRALVANMPFFAILVAWVVFMEGGLEGGPIGIFAMLFLGSFISLVIALLVGTVLDTSKGPRSWWVFVFSCGFCWLVILFIAKQFAPSSD